MTLTKQVVKINLTERQKDILSAWTNPLYKYVVVSCGRQVGKSYAALAISLKTAIACKELFGLSKVKIGFFMPFNDGAREMYERANEFIYGKLSGVSTNSTQRTIKFNNGSIIRFLGAESSKAIRGKFFDFVIVDEACFVKDIVWQEAITATLSRARALGYGKVLLTSTPKEKNWFYDYFIKQEQGYHSIKFTSYESGLHSLEYLEEIRSMTPKAIFDNEYMAEFVDGSKGMFELDRISVLNTTEVKDKVAAVAAVDWGMENDYTVLVMLNKNKEICFLKRWRKVAWHTLLEEINQLLRTYGNPLCYCETNGIGNMPTDELKRLNGVVRPFNTTQSNKTEMIMKLSKDLLIPSGASKLKLINEPYLIEEFENFGFKYDNGSMKFGNLKNDVNDDTVMATAIANYNFKSFGLLC